MKKDSHVFRRVAVAALLTLTPYTFAKVDYHLNKAESPTEDELDAYEHIAAAMDSAVYMYNTYTHLTKHVEVYYNTGVPTAEASYNGTMSFGSGRAYMNVRTAMHEMGHIMGMGTTSEYTSMIVDGVFQGEKAQAKLKELTQDSTVVLKGDSQHFWPYGLNYDSELKSEEDLIFSCQIVEAMSQDIFKESFYRTARVKDLSSGKCMGITSSNALTLMDCSGDSTVTNIWSVGDDPVTYRFEFGSRVIDIPNESTAAGVVASTYSWNAGAHQKYILEASPANTPDAYYLKNYKSSLYLVASSDNSGNILQDNLGSEASSGIWVLQDTAVVDSSVAIGCRAISSEVRPASLENLRKFDAKGRSVRKNRVSKYIRLY